MTCWLCGTPVGDPAPGILWAEGVEVARVCAKHATHLRLVFRGLTSFRHIARVWIERQAAAKAAAIAKAAAATGGMPPVAQNGGK